MPKPVVTFAAMLGTQEHPSGAVQAVLAEVSGHPALGRQKFVTTSAIVKIEYDDDHEATRIETLNTIYEKE